MSDLGEVVVVGIQNRAVSDVQPDDGYVLTWSDGYDEWQPKPVVTGGLRKEYFTSSGTWTCPEGIIKI